ncbi:MAG: MarR family transcriptional regulator [Clostridiales Family XIII bacterium]|nr:MarR family transcriptional regulator [Clostridiales Family XIII bacterium]
MKMNKEEKTVDSILARLFVTTLKIEERAAARSFNNNLSISEMHVLREIGIKDTKTMTQVARGLKISVGALTTAMNKLDMKGYVIRERDTTDRRIVNLCLSKEGRKAYDAHDAFHKQMVRSALDELSEEEQAIFLKSIIRLDAYFTEQWEKSRVKK